MFRIERTDELKPYLSAADPWNRMAGGVPFREAAWARSWWCHFGDSVEPFLVVAKTRENEVAGILPLYRRALSSGTRSVGVIGDGPPCTDYVSVLVRPDQRREVAFEMGRFLAKVSDSWIDGWETLEIDGVVEGDPAAPSLAQGLRQGGATLHTESRMHTWCRPCEGSWEDCLDAMSRKSRRKTRRLLERCDHAGGPLDLRISASREQLHRDLDTLISLHQRRWKEEGQPGSFADDAFRQFVHDACDELFQRDQVFLATLWCGEQAVASSLQLLGENRHIYCYTSGYSTAHADLEPGLVLNVVILRYAHQHGFAAVDYLRGDEPYKARFKAESRRLLKLRAVAPAWFPRIRHAAWMTGFELKQFVRKRIGRKPVDVVDLTAAAPPGHS